MVVGGSCSWGVVVGLGVAGGGGDKDGRGDCRIGGEVAFVWYRLFLV